MDKNILKKFAIEQRKSLEEKVKDRLSIYYATEKDVDIKESGDTVNIKTDKGNNLVLSKIENEHRNRLKSRIEKIGINQVIEEASFTWFNRIIAIRYMELHDFLPLTKDNESLNIRVLSSSDGTSEPDIMKNQNLHNSELDLNINFTELDKITNINDKYEKVLLSVCYKLGKVLPQIFDGETDYIDLLIPKNLLNKDSFLDKLINEVPEDNFNDIEIIGWFYQYYNQSEKDKAMKEKRAYKKTEIPYVTQIFTPDWIVKYMVENSLGRLWVEKNGDEEIIKEFKYFIKDNIEIDNKGIMPENITFIDPCMGSGHILVYAFEVFVKLYIQAGYNKKDIPEKILKNNLYGLDIDDRAGQFAIISIMLKAREYDKDIFNKIDFNKLNILSIQEASTDVLQWTRGIKDNEARENIEYLIETFKNAKEIGSLLIVEDRNYKKVEEYLNKINGTSPLTEQLIKKELVDVVRVAKILSKKYDVVVTNPPYLNNSGMSNNLKIHISNHFNDFKMDIFSAFIIRNCNLSENDRYLGFMTPYVWMFISSYEELRKYIINKIGIIGLNQLEYSALEEAIVPLCTFVIKKGQVKYDGFFVKLSDFRGGMKIQDSKYLEIIQKDIKEYIFFRKNNFFSKIPNNVLAYWLSENMIKCFEKGEPLINKYKAAVGLQTGENERFVRQWFEVANTNLFLCAKSREEALASEKKWFPYNKGGEFRKWYGNNDCVINWSNDGFEIKNYKNEKGNIASVIRNPEYYFIESATWSKISSGSIAFRYKPYGHIFDVAGTSIFATLNNKLKYILGLNNSIVINQILKATSPTLNYEVGQISNIPIIDSNDKQMNEKIENIVDECIEDSKNDWDSFETSWDFKKHPLV